MNPFSSKSSPPILHQPTIERVKLFEKLNLVLQHRLMLVAAPPGYGKTTAVAQFAHQTKCPVVWHSVEERERDVPNLFTHCLDALSTIVPDIETLKQPTSLETAVSITDHLRGVLSSDIIYVFDDIHHLIGSPGAENWLRSFITGLLPICHVILIGRALPTLPLMEMVAHREVLALGQEQLRFSFEEIQALSEKTGASLSASEIQHLTSRLEGWPAGSILALQPLPSEVEAALFRGKPGPEALFDGLAEITFSAQADPLQDFLLASSTLSHMTPMLCRVALGVPDSGEHLVDTQRHNLFISQISGRLVYHPLFRDFLQRHLRKHDPAHFAELHDRAGRWFEDNHHLEEAFDHYVSAQRLDAAAAIAERAAQTYFSQRKIETILYWRVQLSHIVFQIPQLLYTCAMIYADRYEYNSAIEELSVAVRGFQDHHDDLGVIKVSLLQANIDNQRGDFPQAIDRTENLVDRFTLPPNLHAYALFILGIAHFHLGKVETALQHFDTALPLYRDASDAYALSQLLLSLEFAYMRVGRFDAATEYLQEAIGIRRAFGTAVGLAMPLNNLGYDYHLLGEYQQAQHTFQEGLQAASRIADKRVESHLLWSLADLQRDRGDFAEAISLYHKALRQIGPHEPATRCGILTSFATLYRWQGKLEEGLTLAGEATLLAEKYRLPFEQIRSQVSWWAIKAQQGEAKIARQELETAAAAFEKQQAQTRWAQSLALCAQAALLDADAAAASRYLRTAVEGVSHEVNLQPCVAEIVHSPLLRSFVQERSARYSVLIKGIKCLEAARVEAPLVETKRRKIDATPTYSLRVWMLGQERIERDGESVPLSAWRSSAARELFFYLLGKGKTTREQVGLVLWPDSSARQVRQKFHTTLHRVRNAIGTNAICFEDDLYFINSDVEVWCDAIEYGTIIQQARLTSPLRTYTENLWQRAVDLYEGELLPSFDANWIIPQREAWHQMFLEALLELGNCIRLRGNFQEAIVTYQRALEIDTYREDVHRAILTCYAGLGERTSIHRQLEMLTELLDTELGITPSLETLTLAQSLLA